MEEKKLNVGFWIENRDPALTSVLSFNTDYYHNLKFNGTDEDYTKLLSTILKANPHFKYSWETADDFMHFRFGNVANGYGWRYVEINMVLRIERDLVMRFMCSRDYPHNPYWELSKDEFEELKRKLKDYDS